MRYRPSFYYELFEVICLETDIVRIIFYSAAAHNIKMDCATRMMLSTWQKGISNSFYLTLLNLC